MQEHFMNPKTNDISKMIELIENLHDRVSRDIDVQAPRVAGEGSFSYLDELKNSSIPADTQSVETVFEELAGFFKGAVRWNHDKTMINITPPPSIAALAANAYATMYNPNFAQDQVTGGLAKAELLVNKYISDMVGWNWKLSHGVFTFGGKATNLYGVKVGLTKSYAAASKEGVKGDPFTITTIQGHPCHTEVCDWLGIGKQNSVKVPVDHMGRMDVPAVERIISENLDKGRRLACITVNCGTTIQMTVDPIKEVAEMRDRLVHKYNLDYIPHIHADSVIGWSWLFFKNYDFERNVLDLEENVLLKIKNMARMVAELEYVDSLGVDFHKTGFCPYVSSLFLVKNSSDLYNLGNMKAIPIEDFEYGNYSPFQYSLELSRAATGPITAWVNLQLFGYTGYQKLLSQLISVGDYTKELLNQDRQFEVINNDTEGWVTIFMIKEHESTYKFDDISNMDAETARHIASYNYNFYLYLLEKQHENTCSFAFDYTSGYDNSKKGISIGVFKIYAISPYATKASIVSMIDELTMLKKEYDEIHRHYQPNVVLYKPKAFVFR
ncbi:pyridoxal phosphate-dependent decarboxylase family protein [Paenibacillus sp. NPDC058071]|uniref:pyridoxal phosphate-dependent decarboxylase family protein n=1 Tax=Paenibacillus sp. NPDC058071 TaxID=3346326 RepID=UPI0036DB0A78